MALVMNLFYTGKDGSAQAFVREMEASGLAESIRREPGNVMYRYYQPLDDPDTVLLIDGWADQAALDAHHATPMMAQLSALRDKYDLHMRSERYVTDDAAPETDAAFLRP